MMVQGVSISEMLNQSTTVLTKPSVQSFEQFERHGGMREALTYVGVAAAFSAALSFIVGLVGGFGLAIFGLISGLIGPLVGYFVFSYALFWIGKQQGGTGTQDEVFYTTALYTAPIQAISGILGAVFRVIPLLACLAFPIPIALAVYQAYLGYLAARSSMNLDQNKAIISVVVAFIATIVAAGIITGILGAIFLGGAALSGGLQ